MNGISIGENATIIYKDKERLAICTAYGGDGKHVWFTIPGGPRQVVCVMVEGCGWVAVEGDK